MNKPGHFELITADELLREFAKQALPARKKSSARKKGLLLFLLALLACTALGALVYVI